MSLKLALTVPLHLRDAGNCGVLRASARRFIPPTSALSHPGGRDDRVSGTDADRHDGISHNGSYGFRGNADSAEMADLDALIKLIANGPCHRSHDASSSRQQTSVREVTLGFPAAFRSPASLAPSSGL